MEPEGSLPYSQEPATGFYPELDASKSTSSQPTSLRNVLILSSHLCLSLPSGLSPSECSIKILYIYFPLSRSFHRIRPSPIEALYNISYQAGSLR